MLNTMCDQSPKKVNDNESSELRDASKRARSQDSNLSESTVKNNKKVKLSATDEHTESDKDASEDADENSGNGDEKDEKDLKALENVEDENTGTKVEDEEKKGTNETEVEKPSSGFGKFSFAQNSAFSAGFGVASKSFGTSPAFGSGFRALKTSKDVAPSSTPESTSPKPASASNNKEGGLPSSFGSGLAFGGGFNVLKADSSNAKKPISSGIENDKESNSSQPKATSEEPSKEETVNSLNLTKKVIQSGEETEDSVYQSNAKLYQFTDINEGWKERGVGPVHVNKDKKTHKGRLVMRSRGLLKVILNLSLVKGFIVQRGFPGSIQGEKFIRIVAVDEKGEPVQYALKTGKVDDAEELFKTIKDLIPTD
ncbi:HCL169Cp [Eremothecium sinecaudum]|uniref:HCL169Cp n=1 Tax=Eremothecium sinecaudum TaxID=45286 RepID=A0A109UWL9_9SACH|nr:HCL169Cp [Eremothecium sinecaudum]AMD19982.1 HCL169Cp [Eremothecium sinecaudum]